MLVLTTVVAIGVSAAVEVAVVVTAVIFLARMDGFGGDFKGGVHDGETARSHEVVLKRATPIEVVRQQG